MILTILFSSCSLALVLGRCKFGRPLLQFLQLSLSLPLVLPSHDPNSTKGPSTSFVPLSLSRFLHLAFLRSRIAGIVCIHEHSLFLFPFGLLDSPFLNRRSFFSYPLVPSLRVDCPALLDYYKLASLSSSLHVLSPPLSPPFFISLFSAVVGGDVATR